MAHPNFLLNSRTLVIGGSSGIGFAVASAALASGSKVHITSTNQDKLSTKTKALQSFYPNADVHISGSPVDLSNVELLEKNLQSVLDAAVKETGGPLDHIVFTAGDGLSNTPLAEVTVATALAPFTVRYLGALLVAKLVAKLVAANPGRYVTSTPSTRHAHLRKPYPPPPSGIRRRDWGGRCG